MKKNFNNSIDKALSLLGELPIPQGDNITYKFLEKDGLFLLESLTEGAGMAFSYNAEDNKITLLGFKDGVVSYKKRFEDDNSVACVENIILNILDTLSCSDIIIEYIIFRLPLNKSKAILGKDDNGKFFINACN